VIEPRHRLAYARLVIAEKKEPISQAILERLREGELKGEIVREERSHFGPLPEIRLVKPVRLERIIKATKR
jgi:hypothetical protein